MDNRERKVTIWSDMEKETAERNIKSIRKKRIIRQVNGKILKVPVQGFFQANRHLVHSMVNHVGKNLELYGKRYSLDAYCGSGNSRSFWPPLRNCVGFDFDEEAILCAGENLRNEGLTKSSFCAGVVLRL
jgi:tRNA/tmRNA/rRNA uracil-C5-methylase (TrmA/RlmC/RlmD family)